MLVAAANETATRRRLLGASLLLFSPISASVAQPVPVLGYVAAKNADPKRLDAFRQGLIELGYVEGKNIRIEYREAVLDDEYRSVMAELVASKIDIIAAANVAAAVAAAKSTSAVPIVMLAVNDPVGVGLVKSLERPGTNVTGTTMYAPQLIGERLRILSRLVANLDKIAVVLNGNNANNASQLELIFAGLKTSGPPRQSRCFWHQGLRQLRRQFHQFATVRTRCRGSETPAAGDLYRRRICHGRRPDGAGPRSRRRLLRRRQVRGHDPARRQAGRPAGEGSHSIHLQRQPFGAGGARPLVAA
jgi:hypothetical protein